MMKRANTLHMENTTYDKCIELTNKFNYYVKDIKKKLDDFDNENRNFKKQISFLEDQKKEIYKRFDIYFKQLWKLVVELDAERQKSLLRRYNKEFKALFGESIEINWHIYSKPFGYSGDYVAMNYIFDYSGHNYLGKTSFQRLINNYTCNIPFAISNIARKNYLKTKILETINMNSAPRILSVGGGSMRELTELLEEGKIRKKTEIFCLDFEKKAISFVRKKISKLNPDCRKN